MFHACSAPSDMNRNILYKTKIFQTSNKKCIVWFWSLSLKNYCHIWNQHPQICQFAKFRDKTMMSRFGTKNALFGYFWARIFKKMLSYLKQHPRICLIGKSCKKKKSLNLGTQIPYFIFGYFWARILKKLLSWLKSALSNLPKCKISWKNENA